LKNKVLEFPKLMFEKASVAVVIFIRWDIIAEMYDNETILWQLGNTGSGTPRRAQ
jgi:hypothetical protein